MEGAQHIEHIQESSASVPGAELSSFHPIVIGYDGKRAANNLTGLGNYSRWLIGALARRFPASRYLVYTPRQSRNKTIDTFFETENVQLKLPVKKSIGWRSFGIIRDLLRDRVQIFHGLSHEIPFAINKTRIRSVVTIHDLIFMRFPGWYKPLDRFIYKLKSRYACRTADLIIAISERTKQDVVHFYGTDPERIKVIYQNCDPLFKTKYAAERLAAISQQYGLPQRYLLSVGTIEERKNLLQVIEALPAVDADVKLVVVGKQTPYATRVRQAIEKHNLQDRVLLLQNVPFADLPGIYQQAAVFVYPSRYEGFGIPVIEALHSGLPVVAATGSCLEEAGGAGGLYVSPDDPAALAEAVNRILESSALRGDMRRAATAHLENFNDNRLADQLMTCYLNLLNDVKTGN